MIQPPGLMIYSLWADEIHSRAVMRYSPRADDMQGLRLDEMHGRAVMIYSPSG